MLPLTVRRLLEAGCGIFFGTNDEGESNFIGHAGNLHSFLLEAVPVRHVREPLQFANHIVFGAAQNSSDLNPTVRDAFEVLGSYAGGLLGSALGALVSGPGGVIGGYVGASWGDDVGGIFYDYTLGKLVELARVRMH